MSRSRHPRISRALLVVLVLTIVAGVGIYVHRSRAADAAAAKAAEKPASPVVTTTPPPPPPGVTNSTNTPPTTPTPHRTGVATNTGKSNVIPVVDSAIVASAKTYADAPPMPTTSTNASALTDGKAKLDAGQWLEARTILNDALRSNQLSESDALAAKELLTQISQQLFFSPKPVAGDTYATTYTIKSGDSLAKIAPQYSTTPELIARINNITDPKKIRAGQVLKVIPGPFHAVVDKTKFTLDLYLGAPSGKDSLFVRTFGVGLGKDDSTPTGLWMCEPKKKIKDPMYFSPKGDGVTIPSGDPTNPLGTRWIGLQGVEGNAVDKTSYGIHGTIDPNSIGKQESMGCIRLRNEDVEMVFDMLIDGKSQILVK